MVIAGLTVVKNEEDIIESFIRYNLKILDFMIIVDNGSSDGTIQIINALKSEDYNVILINDFSEFDQIHITNSILLRLMSGEFGEVPTFVIPMDADEFIVSENITGTPRSVIESLDQEYIHKIRWLTFIPENTDEQLCFVPLSMCNARADEYESVEKLVVPTRLILSGFVLNNGNHDAFAPYDLKKKRCNELRIAHYPIRSRNQFISKNVIGYFNRLATKNYIMGRSRHIENAYYSIKEHGSCSLEMMQSYAMDYCSSNVPEGAVKYLPYLYKWCEEICILHNNLRRNNITSLFLMEIEAIIGKYRALLVNYSWDTNNSILESDIQSSNAIEQYSFKKMRIERLKRDYYQYRTKILNDWILLGKRGYDSSQMIEDMIVNKTLIFDILPMVDSIHSRDDVVVISSGMTAYESEGSIFALLNDVQEWQDIKQIIIFDPTRIEEISSFAKIKNVSTIINVYKFLDDLVEKTK